MSRVVSAWKGMPGELRLAVGAAGALFVSMFLPWYEKNVAIRGRLVNDGLSAFQAFSFVEAAVLLVALAVVAGCFLRGEQRAFHLPGGDGIALMGCGGWVCLLLVYRLFDKPDVSGLNATVGVQWGIFFALAAAAFLVYAGYRVHAAHRPEPPLPVERRTEPLVRDERPAAAQRPARPAGTRPATEAGRASPRPAPAPPPDEPTVAMPGRRGGGGGPDRPVPRPDDPPEPPATLF